MEGDDEPPDPGGGSSTIETRKRFVRSSEPSPAEPKGKKVTQGTDVDNASAATFYKHPDLDADSRKYGLGDSGPFIVHISRDAESSNSGISLQPIKVGLAFVKDNIKNIKKDGIKSVGRNRVSVEFITAEDANNILENPCLSRHKLIASIPSYNVSRMGLVRGVPVDWSMEEFVDATDLKNGHGKILKARRLQRKVINDGVPPSWVPTQSVVVTFEGQILPEKIFALYTSLKVELYVLPTIQCRKCLRFGHIQSQCRSDARCFKCAQKHPGEGCNVAVEQVTCLYCSGHHYATDQRCPEYCRQKSIKLAMSEHSISYQEASSRFPAVRRPYADVAKVMFEPISSPSWQPPFPAQPPPSPQSSPTISYRKTITRKPRARTPLSPGYDRQAHHDIVSNPRSQVPNGHFLSSRRMPAETPNDDLMELLFKLLTNIIAKWSDCLPPDVAPLMISLAERLSFSNGPPPGQISTMEYS